MKTNNKLVVKFYRTRSKWYRLNRLMFPSAAEVRFMEIMGGKMVTIKWLKHWQTNRPFVYVRTLGKALGEERFEREVRVGRYWIDFGNDVAMGLEIDGAAYHKDVVKQFDRDSYIYQRGWRVMHLPAIRLWTDPAKVQQDVLRFLYA